MGTYARVRVAAESYAIPVSHVVEIRELGEGPFVPGAGPAMLGVRNVRGSVLPVADLAVLLGAQNPAEPSLMLVAESGDVQIGLAIDEVIEVGDMPEPAEPAESSLLSGTAMVGGDLVGVIDMPRLIGTLEGTLP